MTQFRVCQHLHTNGEQVGGGGGTFQVRVGPVLTQHMRGWGGTFHRLCWGRVNTSNRYVVRVVCCVVLFSFCVTLCCVVLCHSLFCFGFFSCVILCSVLVFYFVVLCCVVLCCVVLCCVVLCCVVLCCHTHVWHGAYSSQFALCRWVHASALRISLVQSITNNGVKRCCHMHAWHGAYSCLFKGPGCYG